MLIYPARPPERMEGGTRLVDALWRHRIGYYWHAYPRIMSALSPKLLAYIPLASVSKKYLDVLLRCKACLFLSEHFKACGYLREARNVRDLAESSLIALPAADSYRGALLDLLAYGRLPRGWKVPQLPFLEVRMQPALRDGDAGKKISELEGLWSKSRAEWLRRRVEPAGERITVPGRHGASVRLAWRS